MASLTFVCVGLYFSFIFLKKFNLFSSDKSWYKFVMSLATVMPNTAPLFDSKSSHNDKIEPKSFF